MMQPALDRVIQRSLAGGSAWASALDEIQLQVLLDYHLLAQRQDDFQTLQNAPGEEISLGGSTWGWYDGGRDGAIFLSHNEFPPPSSSGSEGSCLRALLWGHRGCSGSPPQG